MRCDALEHYLNDHLALVVAELALGVQMQSADAGAPLSGYLSEHLVDIAQAQSLLKSLLAARGAGAPAGTPGGLAEELSRLSSAGSDPAALARQLEGLALATQARALLWRCLAATDCPVPEPAEADWGQLAEGAERRLAELRALHTAAMVDAFGAA